MGAPEVLGGKEAPPAYSAAAPDVANEEAEVSLTAAFDNLRLVDAPSDPTADSCLAHLKLLFAMHSMKEDVGYTDGLWGLWDAAAGPMPDADSLKKKGVDEKMRDGQLKTLSQIREKRWAVFVARAVDRYETWWRTLPGAGAPLSESDLCDPSSSSHVGFPVGTHDKPLQWTEELLPPLGTYVQCSPRLCLML